MKKKDAITIVLLAFVFFILFFINSFLFKPTGNEKLIVVVDGKIVRTHSLSENGIYEIKTTGNHVNKYQIDDKKVVMLSADCRDGLCVKTGKIAKNGQMIICLPHKLYLKIESSKNTEKSDKIDVIAE